MSLGLIIINDVQKIEDAISILYSHEQELTTKCKSYIVYTKHDKTEFKKSLKKVKNLFNATYDITNEDQFALNRLNQFHILISVNQHGLKFNSVQGMH